MLPNRQIFLICHLCQASDNILRFSFSFLLHLTGEGKNGIRKFGQLKIVCSWPFVLIKNFQTEEW